MLVFLYFGKSVDAAGVSCTMITNLLIFNRSYDYMNFLCGLKFLS